jgi:hypothetical protein
MEEELQLWGIKEVLGEKVRINNQKLQNINQGFNFANLDKPKAESKRYYIKVLLEISQNFKFKNEILEVEENLFGWRRNVQDFLGDLERYSKKPLIRLRHFNRKNKVSLWGLNFRERTIKFSDIDISIGELAEQKLKELNIDFKEQVKKILGLQEKSDDKLQALADRFVILKEKLLTLKECFGQKSNYYSSKKEDETITIFPLTPERYNEQLKEIEIEIREIASKLGLKIDEYDFKYIQIPKKVGFDEWLKASDEWLKESWENLDEDEQKEHKNFKGYADFMYDEMNGEIMTGEYDDEEDYEEDEGEE